MTERKADARPHFVYRCFDVEGKLLYVGMSENVGRRIKGHKSESGWYGIVSIIQAEKHCDKLAALTAEMIAIIDEKPIYNRRIPTENQVAKLSRSRRLKIKISLYSIRDIANILESSYSVVKCKALKCGIPLIRVLSKNMITSEGYERIMTEGVK